VERFVIEYTVSDECTYSCTVTLPIEYKSAEDLIVDFEAAATKAMNLNYFDREFVLGGITFNAGDFFEQDVSSGSEQPKSTYFGPTILTIDEWFAAPR
jgi:hypothetical protein